MLLGLRVFVKHDRCLGCRTCELACALWRDSVTRRLGPATCETPLPRARVRVIAGPGGKPFPNQCRQCDDAPCAGACPTGALAWQPAPERRGWARDDTGAGGSVAPDSGPGSGARSARLELRHELCIGCYSCLLHCPFAAIIPDGQGRLPARCDACADMEYPACVDSCPVEAIIVAEPSQFDPMAAWEPFCDRKREVKP